MKRKIRLILKRVVLAFLAVNALLIVVGLFWPLTAKAASGNAKPESLTTLLSYDESRNHIVHQINDIIPEKTVDVANYGKAVLWNGEAFLEEIKFTVDANGTYELAVDYCSLQTSVSNITIDVLVNGEVVTNEYAGTKVTTNSENIVLPTYWTDESDEEEYDIYNNQVTAIQVPYKELWTKTFLYDQRYYGLTPIRFDLEAGDEITIIRNQGSFYLGNIYLFEATEAKSYADLASQANYSGDEIITIEGEKPLLKSDTSIQSGSVQSPGVYPYSTKHKMLNVLSGDSFNKSGFSVTYAFEVKEAGHYAFTLKYANTQSNTKSYMDILIDNQNMYKEFTRYSFDSTSKYKNETLKDANGDTMYVYLDKGIHTLTLRIDAALQSEIYYEMYSIINEINALYLEIVNLTGGDVDVNREWNIEAYLPNADDQLNDWVSRLDQLIAKSNAISKVNAKKDNTLTQYITNARNKLKKIAEDPNELPHELANLCTGTASAATLLSNSLHTSTFSPISLDRIFVHQADAKVKKASSNFFLTYFATVQRIVKSGVSIPQGEDILNVWVNRSTYYVSTMQKYVDANYKGGKVRFSILPDESKLTYAYAAGTQPDMALGISSSVPYDLGLRGALEDLTQFADFNQVITNFAPGALLNLGFNNGIYGLPETQDFQVLYYRTDLFERFNIDVPNSWTDVIEMLPDLQRRGMNFYIPMAGGSGLKSISQTASFIHQFGGRLYADDYMSSAIDSKESMNAIYTMVDLFQQYSLPLTSQNFYDSFRNGTIPAGVANFDVYLQLANAAPEIEGKWKVALHPGVALKDSEGNLVKDEQGNQLYNRSATGDTRNGVIFKGIPKTHKEMAWKFLAWWLSTETQTGFANTIQSTYGSTFLWNTANLEAFKTLAIADDIKEVVLEQLEQLENVAQIPATYIIERGISNIWNQAVFDNKSVRALISDGTLEMDREITRKMKEFGFIDDNDEIIKPYRLFTIEDIKKLQEDGREQIAKGGSN